MNGMVEPVVLEDIRLIDLKLILERGSKQFKVKLIHINIVSGNIWTKLNIFRERWALC